MLCADQPVVRHKAQRTAKFETLLDSLGHSLSAWTYPSDGNGTLALAFCNGPGKEVGKAC